MTIFHTVGKYHQCQQQPTEKLQPQTPLLFTNTNMCRQSTKKKSSPATPPTICPASCCPITLPRAPPTEEPTAFPWGDNQLKSHPNVSIPPILSSILICPKRLHVSISLPTAPPTRPPPSVPRIPPKIRSSGTMTSLDSETIFKDVYC